MLITAQDMKPLDFHHFLLIFLLYSVITSQLVVQPWQQPSTK